MGEQSEAAKRAAARKAKILARGNTGLNKLAQTARGEEAEKLYGESESLVFPTQNEVQTLIPVSASRPTTPSVRVETEPEAASGSKPSWTPPPNSTSQPAGRPQQSAEQQQMSDQLNAMMSMFGGAGGPGGEGMPDMSQMFAQMMGGGGPPGLGGAGGMPADRLLGDLDDPAGLGVPSPGFPDLSALAGGMGGMGGAGGMPGFPGMVPARKSWIERVFPLIHALAMVLLVGFTVMWWEPRVGAGRVGHIGRGWAARWGDLRGQKRFGDDFRISALVRGVEALVSRHSLL